MMRSNLFIVTNSVFTFNSGFDLTSPSCSAKTSNRIRSRPIVSENNTKQTNIIRIHISIFTVAFSLNLKRLDPTNSAKSIDYFDFLKTSLAVLN